MNHVSYVDVTCDASQMGNSTYVMQRTVTDCQCAHLGRSAESRLSLEAGTSSLLDKTLQVSLTIKLTS